MYWERSSLEYLFVKETYLANVLTVLVAKDITTKLYAMNNKVRFFVRNLGATARKASVMPTRLRGLLAERVINSAKPDLYSR